MTPRFRAAGALLLAAALFPAAARAQGPDARTLQRGWLEFRAAGLYQQFNSRFADGGSEPLGAGFQAELTPLAEGILNPLVGPVRTGLSTFFANTAGQVQNPVTPAEVTGGTLRAELANDVRRGAFSLAYGLTRRITVQVTVPIERNGTPVTGLGFAGSNLGLNTQAAANAAVLAKIDTAYAALGRSTLLPVAGSPAAVELQRRVKALTKDTLVFPTAVASISSLFQQNGLITGITREDSLALRTTSAATLFSLGDIEAGVRLQLMNTTGGASYALGRPTGMRAALAVNARIPTGPKADTAFLLILPRQTGHFGVSGELTGDAFFSGRFWVTGSAAVAKLFGADVVRHAFSAARPFPEDSIIITARREPGTRMSAALLPRYRLTREMSFAAGYRFDHQGATTYGGDGEVVLGPIERTDAWTAHSLSLGASYSTIQAFEAGKARVPFEVSLLYHNSFAGSGYAPHAGTLEVVGRFIYQAVGRPRRPRAADSTAVDSARTLPAPAAP
ncbi:MAG TPA: hypothetical protein VFJ82_13430, partial [Longimicrobium sp.]|nr:hypothetical protein [Longimicrobium sp.]